MRCVIQRVSQARVDVSGVTVGSIGQGLMVLVAVHIDDTPAQAQWMAKKIANLRIFEDEEKKLNAAVVDVGGAVLAVSQFTLYGDCRKGNRPSFLKSASGEQGRVLYERFVQELSHYVPVQTGQFGAFMDVHLVNDGPTTVIIDSV